MAARANLVLDEEHRARIADGTISLSELASELGSTKQNLSARFKKLGWITRPALEAPTSPSEDISEVKLPSPQPAPNHAPTGSSAPLAAVAWGSGADLAEVVRYEALNASLLLLDQVRSILLVGRPGAQSLKAASATLDSILDRLERLGLPVLPKDDDPDLNIAFEEYSPSEMAEIQREAELGHDGSTNISPADDEDDDFEASDSP